MTTILYFGRIDTRYMATWQKVHFMDELYHYGFEFDIFNPFEFESWDEANEALVKYVEKTHPAMFFTLTGSTRKLFVSSIESIKQMGVPTLFFVSDSLATPYEDKEIACHFDLVWITEPETKYLYDRWGIKNFVAPYAANPFAFNMVGSNFRSAACFIGRAHGSRANMINALAAEGTVQIDIFDKNNDNGLIVKSPSNQLKGYIPPAYLTFLNYTKYKVGRKLLWSSFKNRFVNKQNTVMNLPNVHHLESIPYDEMARVYSEYSLALSSTSYHNTDVLKNPVEVINLRAFEIPMSGGLQICRYNSYLAELYEDGKEIIFYKTEEELRSKANYYINKAKDCEIRQLKTAARTRSENDHTWLKRFEIIFKEFGIQY